MYFWLVVDKEITIANNVFAFQLASAIDAAIRHLITEDNEELPITMFRIDHDPGHADKVRAKPPCRRDAWSAEHMKVEEARPNGLLNSHAKQKRLQISRLAWMDLVVSINVVCC